jgi:transposase
MRYITATPPESVTLSWALKDHPKANVRRRCYAIALSTRGKSVSYIKDLLNIPDKTVYRWFDRWEASGIIGMFTLPGQGVKALLDTLNDAALEAQVKTELELNPQQLALVAETLSTHLSQPITYGMLKRYVKNVLGCTWKRLKKWLKPKQNPIEYARLWAELEQIKALEAKGFIEVFYGDQSSFSLNPNVPYGWQPKTYTKIVPQKGVVSNVFGLLSKKQELESYICTGTMTSAFMIALIEDFISKRTQPTVIVLDNAPIHKSAEFLDAMEEWKEKYDLNIFFLPTYSPHLNPIETLWRKMKYEWLKPHDYQNRDTLSNAVEHILCNYGSLFTINFA